MFYMREYRKGQPRTVSNRAAFVHIRNLVDMHGLTCWEIGKRAGIHNSAIYGLYNRSRGKRLRPETESKILGVQP